MLLSCAHLEQLLTVRCGLLSSFFTPAAYDKLFRVTDAFRLSMVVLFPEAPKKNMLITQEATHGLGVRPVERS